MVKFREFLKRKDIEFSIKRYLMDALSYMALGLFSSLLIGTILATLGDKLGIESLVEVAGYAKSVAGSAMGVAIAYALKAPPLVMFSIVTVGMVGNALGGPVGALVATICATEIGKAVSKETKVDLIVTPAVTIMVGVFIANLTGPFVSSIMDNFGQMIMKATELEPLYMGIIVSVLVGVALTLPISSAAICIMLDLSGITAGAATAGCCAQMVGFAAMSFKENGVSGLVSQGLGTSMLQIPNIIKNPFIWIPPTVAAAITGPLATVVFKLENIPTGAGMGTSGLVGPLGVMTAMGTLTGFEWLGLALICFILPALISTALYIVMKKMNIIKTGDVKLEL